ncbi:tripartite tricarboxylate transporter substrate binding protein [Micromonospora sp. WMMD558]|uniref:tripartite tricarboxylate transporter substrate binding protein n=1 Tax=Micromonospora sp. WMMD558 TaxID=3403462 RepID=UPI003BF4E4C0
MKFPSLVRRSTVVAAIAALALTAGCQQQQRGGGDYPSDSITLLVPYAAGGTTDRMARVVAENLQGKLGKPVVVTNKPGGGGAIAITELMKAKKDGHTIAIIATPTALIPPVLGQATYQPKDLAPIGLVAEQPIVVVTSAKSRFANAADFIAAAKAKPESVTIGTNGPTTSAGIEVKRFADEYGVKLKQVPFQGEAELSSALLGGNIDAMVTNASPATLSKIEGGQARPLAIFTPQRVPYLPEVPTFVELGFPKLTLATSRFGLVAGGGVPQEVLDKLAQTLRDALKDAKVIEGIGEQYVPKEFVDGTQWGKEMDEITKTYQEAVSG